MFRHRAVNWLMLLALTVMWGSAFMLTKIAVAELPLAFVTAGRLGVACLLLLGVTVIVRQRLPRERRVWIFCLAIALFGNVLPFSLIGWGQRFIDSSLAGILMAVMPLVTLVLAHYLIPGERMTPYRAGGFVLGFLGVVVLMGLDTLVVLSEGAEPLWAMLAVLGGAVCYAIAAILARLRPVSGALSTAATTTLIATCLMLPVVLQGVATPRLLAPTPIQLLAVMLLGVFCTAIAAVVYFRLIHSAGAAFVSQLNYLIPLWAVFVGMLFLDETLELRYLYALLLILGGVFLTQLERQPAAPLQRPTGEAST